MKKKIERKWEDRVRMEMKVCEMMCESVKWVCEKWIVGCDNVELCVRVWEWNVIVMGWVSNNDNEDDED